MRARPGRLGLAHVAGGGLPASGAGAGEPAADPLYPFLLAQHSCSWRSRSSASACCVGSDVPEAIFVGMGILPISNDPARMSDTRPSPTCR
jgi:hypothetical protein